MLGSWEIWKRVIIRFILFYGSFLIRFVKKKFEELYFQSTAPDRVDRVFKIYRTTALDQKLVKKTFKLVDETLRRRNLFEAGLLWRCQFSREKKNVNIIEELLRFPFFFFVWQQGLVATLPCISQVLKKIQLTTIVLLCISQVLKLFLLVYIRWNWNLPSPPIFF